MLYVLTPASPTCRPMLANVRLPSSRSNAPTYGAAYGLASRVAVRKHPAYRPQNPCSRSASAGIAAGLIPQRSGLATAAVESRLVPCSDSYHNGTHHPTPPECDIVKAVTTALC
jgi:hypothetical protein